jgi:hypothetical protein
LLAAGAAVGGAQGNLERRAPGAAFGVDAEAGQHLLQQRQLLVGAGEHGQIATAVVMQQPA